MRIWISALLGCLTLSHLAFAKETPAIDTPTMSLEEIEVGMQGEWETVVQGTETVRYHFEVIGVVPNFIGPKRSAILAKATDPSQILSGPVGGMSGSPCYIDGKLIGAYAYGYTWPKEQAIIGITPIADMFDALEKESQRTDATKVARSGSFQGATFSERLDAWGDSEKAAAVLASIKPFSSSKGPALTALPTPLFASGVSAPAMEPFANALSAMGLEPMQSPIGAASNLTEADIKGGSPLAGVLMDGDFRFGAIGTVTWREGDTFLAFGHPFFGSGDVELPIAPAEVLTVIQSLPRSFKLANSGEIVGSLRQDRLTAVYGEIGEMAEMTPVSYSIHGSDDTLREYKGKMFRDRSYSPLIAAIGLMQTLMGTMETSEEQTFTMKATYRLEGYEPLVLARKVTGPGAGQQLAIQTWLLLSLLMDNPFEQPIIESIDFEIEQTLGWQATSLEALRSLSGQPKSGEDWRFGVTLGRYLESPYTESLSVPIPTGSRDEKLTVFVGDAAAADRLERGWTTSHVTSFAGLLDYLRQSRANDRMYVMLLRSAPGLRIDGQNLPALPPSARLLLDNERTVTQTSSSQWQTLWSDEITVPGVFSGSYYHNLKVR